MPALPPDETLTLRVTCTNRDQAAQLKLSGELGELQAEGAALLRRGACANPHLVRAPADAPGNAVAADFPSFSKPSFHRRQGEGGSAGDSAAVRFHERSGHPETDRRNHVRGQPPLGKPRTFRDWRDLLPRDGRDIEFDEEQYVGTGVFLLASVLRRFLGLYSAVNSFSRMTAKTRKGVLKQWPPLAGEQILL